MQIYVHYACKRKSALDIYDKLSLWNITLYGAYLTTKYCCSVSGLTGEMNSTAVCYCQTANQNNSVEPILALFTDTNFPLSTFPEIIEERSLYLSITTPDILFGK